MATFSVTNGLNYTGTPQDDQFTVTVDTDGTSQTETVLDGANGDDLSTFISGVLGIDEAGDLGSSDEGVTNGGGDGDDQLVLTGVDEDGTFNFTLDSSNTVDDDGNGNSVDNNDTYELSNFETLTFDNGTITSAASSSNPQTIAGAATSFRTTTTDAGGPTDTDDDDESDAFEVAAPLVFNGETLETSNAGDLTITSVAGTDASANERVTISQGGQTAGSVRVGPNEETFTFSAAQSFLNSVGPDGEEVTFTVSSEAENGETFSQDYTVTVASQVQSGSDFTDGDDRFVGNEVPDGVINVEAAGGNTNADEEPALSGPAGGSFPLSDDADTDIIDAQDGDDFLNGNQGADVLFGNAGNDEIFAGPSDDSGDFFVGGDGDDEIGGGAGNDILTGDGDTRDAIDFLGSDDDDGSDVISGGAGDDEIHTGSWDGTNSTGEADDVAYAGDGNDIIIGAGGNDTLGGGNGDDTVRADNGNDIIYGGSDDGADVLRGQSGNDRIFGGGGDDRVAGGNNADTLFNGGGSDNVFGGAGEDTLWGGAGDDTLNGSADDGEDDTDDEAVDTFAFVEGNGNDTIEEFNQGTDLIDLSNVAGFNSFNDVEDQLAQITDGGETSSVVFYGDNNSITVDGVDTLTEDDFIF